MQAPEQARVNHIPSLTTKLIWIENLKATQDLCIFVFPSWCWAVDWGWGWSGMGVCGIDNIPPYTRKSIKGFMRTNGELEN